MRPPAARGDSNRQARHIPVEGPVVVARYLITLYFSNYLAQVGMFAAFTIRMRGSTG